MHLAQLNVSRMLAPIDSRQMSDFVARIDKVNARAEAAQGFVWRLQEPVSQAVLRRVFGESDLLVNLSVWESAPDLRAFVFQDDRHAEALRGRRSWFAASDEPMEVCWWMAEGSIPTLREAAARLALLRSQGPGREAFPLAAATATWTERQPPVTQPHLHPSGEVHRIGQGSISGRQERLDGVYNGTSSGKATAGNCGASGSTSSASGGSTAALPAS